MNQQTSSVSLASPPGHTPLPLQATMAFQPIVDVNAKTIFGYEALLRGRNNEPAADVLAMVATSKDLDFDLACAAAAIHQAIKQKVSSILSINLSARALSSPEKAVELLAAVIAASSLPAQQIMFEITSETAALDSSPLRVLIAALRRQAIQTCIDGFGDRQSGLDILADLRPDAVKLSMKLIRKIEVEPVHLAIVTGITQMCTEIGIRVIAVGVETAEECRALREAGVHLFQGYCFATPRFEGLPGIPETVWPRIERRKPIKRRNKNRDTADRRKTW